MTEDACATSYTDEDLNLIALFTSNDVNNVKLALQLQQGLRYKAIDDLLLGTFCPNHVVDAITFIDAQFNVLTQEVNDSLVDSASTFVQAYVGGYLPEQCFDTFANCIFQILARKTVYAHEKMNLQLYRRANKFFIQNGKLCMKTVGNAITINEMFIYGNNHLVKYIELDNVHIDFLSIYCLSIESLSIPNAIQVRITSRVFVDVFHNLGAEVDNLANAMQSLNNEFIELHLNFKTEDMLTHLFRDWNCDKIMIFASSILAVLIHVIEEYAPKIFSANPRLKEISYTDSINARETIYRNRLQ